MTAVAFEAEPQLTALDPDRVPPRARMAIALLSLVGLFVAIYLLLHRAGVVGSLACGVDGGCSTVQSSAYATFLGLPVPLLGVVGYAGLFALSMASLTARGLHSRALAATLLGGAVLAFVFSAYLTVLEAFVIHAWCRWCVVSALLATGIFLCALTEIPRLRSTASGETS